MFFIESTNNGDSHYYVILLFIPEYREELSFKFHINEKQEKITSLIKQIGLLRWQK